MEGRLQTRQWEDREGQRRYTTEVVAQDIQFLDRAGGAAFDEGGAAGNAPPPEDASVDADDLPFE